MSVYLFVPSVFVIISLYICVHEWFVISRRHLEGSILLRWVNWQVTFFFAVPCA